MKKIVVSVVFTLLLVCSFSLVPRTAQAQCTMCKSQVEASRTEKSGYNTTGLNRGILYLMVVPYVLIGSVGFFWYRNSHKKKQRLR